MDPQQLAMLRMILSGGGGGQQQPPRPLPVSGPALGRGGEYGHYPAPSFGDDMYPPLGGGPLEYAGPSPYGVGTLRQWGPAVGRGGEYGHYPAPSFGDDMYPPLGGGPLEYAGPSPYGLGTLPTGGQWGPALGSGGEYGHYPAPSRGDDMYPPLGRGGPLEYMGPSPYGVGTLPTGGQRSNGGSSPQLQAMIQRLLGPR